ncbi:MAG: hypothetical protein M1358_25415 [Chloroflexi bacterium]|nr:hypothetical protein [Chloroflexota bacterium]
MKRRLAILGLALLVIVAVACGPPAPSASERTATPVVASSQPPTTAESRAGDFALGIEYASAGLAGTYATLGIQWVKLWPGQARWGEVEPKPGQFRWDKLDGIVREYQSAGFPRVELLLTSDGHKGKPSDPNFVTAYAEYARWVVERYDGDGLDDMPGLLYPVHHFGVEREFTAYWPFSGQDYLNLLKAVYPVIKQADPQAQVLLVAILVMDVFDTHPTPEQAMGLLRDSRNDPRGMRKSGAEILALLDQPTYFDIVDFHSLGDYTEIPLTVAWLRAEMASRGYEKPIWIGDATSMSPLIAFGNETCQKGPGSGRALYPATEETRCQAAELIEAARQKSNPDHELAMAWIKAESAKGLVKKAVVSAGEGLAGINIGNLDDWPIPWIGTGQFQGMVDTSLGGGSRAPRPAYYSLQMVVEKLRGFQGVERLSGLGGGVWAYRFTVGDRAVYVAWHEPSRISWPGEIEPLQTVALAWDMSQAVLTPIVTEPGQTAPASQTVATDGQELHLDLTSVPVFVEAP